MRYDLVRRAEARRRKPLDAVIRREQRRAMRVSGLVSAWETGMKLSEIAELAGTSQRAIGKEIEYLRRDGHPFPLRSRT